MATAEIPIERRRVQLPKEVEPSFRHKVCKKLAYMSQEQFTKWLVLRCVPFFLRAYFWWKLSRNSDSIEAERWLCTDIAFSKDLEDAENAFNHYFNELETYRSQWKISCGFAVSKAKLLKTFREFSPR